MLRMRQWIEPLREEVLLADLVRAHRRQTFPSNASRQFDADPLLHRFCSVDGDALGGAVAQVVALIEQRVVLLFNAGFSG